MPNDRIGPWRVEAALGQGGMGVVCRARHEVTGIRAALKTVRSPSAALVEVLRREIVALSRLDLPGVVRILDHGIAEGMPWLAMEWVEGPTLRERWRELSGDDFSSGGAGSAPSTWLPELDGDAVQEAPSAAPGPAAGGALHDVLDLFRQLCTPLAHLHAAGWVHRDLKPDNVIVGGDGAPVLVDLGLLAEGGAAGRTEGLGSGRRRAGSPSYMAPEQVRGEEVDARADLYALGCMLYELVTGRPPYLGSAKEVMQQHLHGNAEPPSTHVHGVPPALDTLVLSLLATERAERPGRALDVARALEALGAPGRPFPDLPPTLYRARLAGREPELRALREQLQAAEAGGGGVVLLVGESGVGKTRLVLELTHAAGPEVRVVTASCEPDRPLTALAPLLQVMADEAREAGLPHSTNLGRRTGRAVLLEAARAALVEAAAGRTTLLVVDDLHLADDLSIRVLHQLAAREPVPGLLVVATLRREQAEVLEALGSHPTRIALGPLAVPAVGAVVADMLALREPPDLLARHVARHAEGNPFFVAEYLREAVAAGLLRPTGTGRWTVGPPGGEVRTLEELAALPLPRTLRDLLDRRLDALPRAALDLLDAAAILGREVPGDLLREVLPAADPGAASALVRRGVLEDRGEGVLAFAHDKLREAVLSRLPPERAVPLHRRAADALDRRGAPPGERARHRDRAGEPDRALPLYLEAARAAHARFALPEAVAAYRAVLALEPSERATAWEARLRLGEDLLNLGRGIDAEPLLEEALGLSATALERASVLHQLVRVHHQTSRDERALPAAEEATRLLQGAVSGEDPEERVSGTRILAGLRNIVATIHLDRNEPDAARLAFEEALEAARAVGDRELEADTLSGLGGVRYLSGDLEGAASQARLAADLLEAIGHASGAAMSRANLAGVRYATGDVDGALDAWRSALRVADEVGERWLGGRLRAAIGAALAARGELPAGAHALRRGLEQLRAAGDLRATVVPRVELAETLARQGKHEEAAAALTEAEAAAAPIESRRLIARLEVGRCTVARLAGRPVEADGLEAHLDAMREQRDVHTLVPALAELGHLRLHQGLPADDLLAEAREAAAASRVDLDAPTALAGAVRRLTRAVDRSRAGRPLLCGEAPEGR